MKEDLEKSKEEQEKESEKSLNLYFFFFFFLQNFYTYLWKPILLQYKSLL